MQFTNANNSIHGLQAVAKGQLLEVLHKRTYVPCLDGLPIAEAYGAYRLMSSCQFLFRQGGYIVGPNGSGAADGFLVTSYPPAVSELFNQANNNPLTVVGTASGNPPRLSISSATLTPGNWYTINSVGIVAGVSISDDTYGFFRSITPLTVAELEMVRRRFLQYHDLPNHGAAILDFIGVPSLGAYATFRLSKSYNGPALRVKFGANTLDVGFDEYDHLDEQAIASWNAWDNTGTIQIDRWYDQSGNGRDMEVSSDYPTIYEGGWQRVGTRMAANFYQNKYITTNEFLPAEPYEYLLTSFVCPVSAFPGWHQLLGSSPSISSFIPRYAAIVQNGDTGAQVSPPAFSIRRNGVPRTVAPSGTYAPITSPQIVSIDHSVNAGLLFFGERIPSTNGCLRQSFGVALKANPQLSRVVMVENALMQIHGIS